MIVRCCPTVSPFRLTAKKAFTERQIALLVALVVELPVLFVITNGGNDLCQFIGRKKFKLLIGLIPLTCAISGNVGLQASTRTARAIAHTQVARSTYMSWLVHEVGCAFCLGGTMGLLLSGIAYVSSGYDGPFATTIFAAQTISVITAGITGTLAPLLCTWMFGRDSRKWSCLLETGVQDIVGCLVMIVLPYYILTMFGHRNIDPLDTCSLS
jgi:Mg/Co/Ni transporter MgtE